MGDSFALPVVRYEIPEIALRIIRPEQFYGFLQLPLLVSLLEAAGEKITLTLLAVVINYMWNCHSTDLHLLFQIREFQDSDFVSFSAILQQSQVALLCSPLEWQQCEIVINGHSVE